MKRIFVMVVAATSLVACSSKTSKKVLVMGKGTLSANGTNITYKEGAGYTETTIELTDEGASQLQVSTDGQKKDITIPAETGFYILNLRADTVTGSKQNLGSDLNSGSMITQEQLRTKIDSLITLTNGQVPAGANDVYIIAPNAVAKVSNNIHARVFGPFTKVPAQLDAAPDGKELELYKFRTNTEMRELINTMEEATR